MQVSSFHGLASRWPFEYYFCPVLCVQSPHTTRQEPHAMLILTGMGSNHFKSLLAFEPGKNSSTTSAEFWGLRQRKQIKETWLFGERGAESTMLGSVTCQAALLSTACRARMSWQHLPGLFFDPLKTRCGFGPLVEQPTSAKGRIQGWGKHLLGFLFWCFSNQRPEEPFYPQKNGCSCTKWLQTSASPPLLPLPLPSFLNINMNKITLSMITYAQ